MLRRLILRQVSGAAAESKLGRRIHGFDQRVKIIFLSFWISIRNDFLHRIGSVIQRLIGVWGVQRGIHSRNKKAMEYVAKGWSAIKEVDRVIDYCELNDRRLIPLLRVLYFTYYSFFKFLLFSNEILKIVLLSLWCVSGS